MDRRAVVVDLDRRLDALPELTLFFPPGVEAPDERVGPVRTLATLSVYCVQRRCPDLVTSFSSTRSRMIILTIGDATLSSAAISSVRRPGCSRSSATTRSRTSSNCSSIDVDRVTPYSCARSFVSCSSNSVKDLQSRRSIPLISEGASPPLARSWIHE